MLRRKPLKPGKPMRSFRKKRRPGNRPMTAEESARVMQAKETVCVPCYVWARNGNMPLSDVARISQYDHSKSGNIRRGHGKGFASCLWHHQGRLEQPDCWTHAAMRAHFGPSLMDGSRLFHETYGSDDELIALQDELLGIPSEEAA